MTLLWFTLLAHIAISASNFLHPFLIKFSNYAIYREVMSEYETVVYSYLKNKHLYQRPVFFGALYHSKDT